MADFAADLALCRMADIKGMVKDVHAKLDALEREASGQGMRRVDETLLASLVPTIRQGFVRPVRDEAQLDIEIIRWCNG